MKKLITLSIALTCIAISSTAFATPKWSSCQTVTAVSDYRAYNESVYLTVSPGVEQCGGGIRRMRIMAGQNHATFETVQSTIALGSTALVTGKKVQFYYDSSSAVCFIRIVALGGYSGQCK